MLSANSESPRDYVIKFLSETLKRLPENKLTSELEEFIVEQTNNVLQDVSETEFIQLISVMSTLKCMSSLTGRQKLVGMITDQVIQAVPVFNPLDTACVAQVRESGKQAVRFLSVSLHIFLMHHCLVEKYICCNVSEVFPPKGRPKYRKDWQSPWSNKLTPVACRIQQSSWWLLHLSPTKRL